MGYTKKSYSTDIVARREIYFRLRIIRSLTSSCSSSFQIHITDRRMSIGDTARHLSEFQVTKFKYMFSAFFDIEENGLIEQDDIFAFGNRMCQYTGWKEGSPHKERATDILSTFYECVKDQVKAEYLNKEKKTCRY